jgi:hypothetical protein
LKDLDNSLLPRTNEYGRVDKTAKFLLAQIYLNAKVYIGVDRFNEAATLSNEIITSSGYTFANVAYKDLFSADNNRNGSQSEFIFPIVSDNAIRATGAGMSFIMHASMEEVWTLLHVVWTVDGKVRTRKEFVNLFLM